MSLDADLNRALDGTFEGLIGTVYDSCGQGEITGHLNLGPDLLSHDGETALGVYATVAEGAASIGSVIDAADLGLVASGMSNDTTVTRRISDGRIRFRAKCQNRAADLSIWSVEFHDENESLVACSTVRVALRRKPPPAR